LQACRSLIVSGPFCRPPALPDRGRWQVSPMEFAAKDPYKKLTSAGSFTQTINYPLHCPAISAGQPLSPPIDGTLQADSRPLTVTFLHH
jgi:hypothetical protein